MNPRAQSLCLVLACLTVGCGGHHSSDGSGPDASTATGGESETGGAAATTGGSTSDTSGRSSGGTTSSQAGSGTGAVGGVATSGGMAGTGGSSADGGAATGGAAQTGGTSSGGGSATGGASETGGAGEPGAEPLSCRSSGPGLSDCGSSGESCCASITVPGGTFFRTYTNDGSGATDTADPATISDLRLDKYLVTVGRFRAFVTAWDGGSGYTPPVGSGKHAHLNGGQGLLDCGGSAEAYEPGWTESDGKSLSPTNETLACDSAAATWTATPGDHEKLPINCVGWAEAYAFCIWDGGFLPSEAELEYAAAGGSEQREYPWGSTEPGTNNEYAIYGCYYPDGSGTCNGIASIAPVGSAPSGAGLWGQLDLAGNLQQWILDFSSPSYVNPCTDCAFVAKGSGRAMRDGYYGSAAITLLVAPRTSFYPTNRFSTFGIRCARTP
jgi:formylglycine-generating enzyme